MFGELGSDYKGWGLTTLGQCCELNPKRPRDIDDELMVSFVPMPAVSEDGKMDCSNIRPYKEVRKGFTYFAEDDVLFAKITPCMENGKGAVARGLEGGIGSGSTEFHVLRPIAGKSNPYWLYIITMFDSFRIGARKVMTGTGGQLRVPIGYLNDYPISLPPIELQNRFEEFIHQSDKSKFIRFKSQFIELFSVEKGWPIAKLEELCDSIVRGPFGSALKVSFFVDKGSDTVKVYEQKNAIQRSATLGDSYVTQEKYNELKRFECGPGDFIMSCSGTIGCLYQLPDDAEPGIINQALCKFHLNGKMLPEVFLTYMRNSVDQLETKGSAIKNIGAVSFIKNMEIALPPIAEQEAFAEFIRQSDKSKYSRS